VERPGELAASSLLAVGGIDYGSPGEGAGAASLAGPSWSGALDRARPPSGFQRLAETSKEVEIVSRLFGERAEKGPITMLQGLDATTDAFVGLAPSARFVHLATHGYFAPDSILSRQETGPLDEKLDFGQASTLGDQVRELAPMLLCGLAFAGANEGQRPEDRAGGLMTAEELAAVDLSRCELVVLSACETNVGERRSGQGIASLQQALYGAGAASAMTSLWKVPDEATQVLMGEFYRKLWVLKEPAARALHQAKKMLRQQKDEQGRLLFRTVDWAGWVLTGEGG